MAFSYNIKITPAAGAEVPLSTSTYIVYYNQIRFSNLLSGILVNNIGEEKV